MPRLLNLDLLRSPYNWAVVVSMLIFGLFLVALIAPQDKSGA